MARVKVLTEVAAELSGITTADLRAKIREVSKAFPPLYTREWSKSQIGSDDVPLSDCVTFLQYNILAEGLSYGPGTPPCPDLVDPSQDPKYYGGFEVPNPEVVFDFSKRKYRLLEDILRFEPSIITLQECDHFSDFFSPALQKFGYSGVFQPKQDAPGMSAGYYSDGVAIFWKDDAFIHDASKDVCGGTVQQDGKPLKATHAIIKLEHRNSERRILVATTHLKAKVPNESIREAQVQGITSVIEAAKEPDDLVLFAGDFNTDPFPVSHKDTISEPLAVNHLLKDGFSSAYELPKSENEELYSTWKFRNGEETRHVIDFIFHGPDIECIETLDPPAASTMEPTRLPGMKSPSDHIPIAAKLHLKKLKKSKPISAGTSHAAKRSKPKCTIL